MYAASNCTIANRNLPLREECLYSELFQSTFSRIWTEYRGIKCRKKVVGKTSQILLKVNKATDKRYCVNEATSTFSRKMSAFIDKGSN